MKELLFGFETDDLDAVAEALQRVLGVRMEERDSLYSAGTYYSFRGAGDEEFVLKANWDVLDGEPAEPDFERAATLLYVSSDRTEQLLESIISAQLPGAELLRRSP
jgi:hypothetical protein